MGKPYLSRHFVGERGSAVASIPFPAPLSHDHGSFLAHNLLAVGSWSEDAQEHRLSIFDVAVRYSGPEASTPALNRLASFQHPGAVVATKAVDLGGGSVVLVTATDEGSICRLRMQVPTSPGSSPDNINLQGEDLEDTMVKPCIESVHKSCITAMDMHPETKRVLTVAADGSLAVSSIDSTDCSTSTVYTSNGASMFTTTAWASSNTGYTGSLHGQVQGWDIRSASKPTLSLADQHAVLKVAVNPAQPFLCAASYAQGGISIWDTRNGSRPIQSVVTGIATGMQFIAGDAVAYRQAQLVFCTSKGMVGLMDSATGSTRSVYQEPTAGMEGLLATSSGAVNQLFVLSDQEGILFIANAL